MKRRIVMLSLVLVTLLLVAFPGAAMARNSGNSHTDKFTATGSITAIDQTIVGENAFPLGNSDRWFVKNRSIYGSLDGDIQDNFILTYGGIFSIETQAGWLLGSMKAGDRSFFVTGKIDPYEIVLTEYGYLPKLNISGSWLEKSFRLFGRNRGISTGSFNAWLVFVPDEFGHVVQILASSFEMTGR